MDERLVIISIPKAGTYLVSEIARLCGWKQTYWHVREDSMEDYSSGSMEERRVSPEKFRHPISLEQVAVLAPERSFFVGHVPCTRNTYRILSPFRKIFAVRELREALVSRMRFERRLRRSPVLDPVWDVRGGDRPQMEAFMTLHGANLIRQIAGIIPWMDHPDVGLVRFEDMLSASAQRLETLGKIFGSGAGVDLGTVHAALQADTLTKAPKEADFGAFWSPKCENVFAANKGPLLNMKLGYGSA